MVLTLPLIRLFGNLFVLFAILKYAGLMAVVVSCVECNFSEMAGADVAACPWDEEHLVIKAATLTGAWPAGNIHQKTQSQAAVLVDLLFPRAGGLQARLMSLSV